MNENTLEKYYLLFLYKKVPELYLIENKVLDKTLYTPNQISGMRDSFTELKTRSSVFNTFIAGIEVNIPYLEYDFHNVDYEVANDSAVDGFCYDEKNGKVIYGYTFIYAILKDGVYREIITGREIIDASEHIIKEVQRVPELKKMYNHLELISKYRDIYEKTLSDVMEKLAIGYRNHLEAYQSYTKIVHDILKQNEENSKRERRKIEEELLEKSCVEREEELVKIRKLILEMRCSSI